MLLHPKALRQRWPKTPKEYNELYVYGHFDAFKHSTLQYQYGTLDSVLRGKAMPDNPEDSWQYLCYLYNSLGIPTRSEWAVKNAKLTTFELNFKALAAAEYVIFDYPRVFLWPQTFAQAVTYSKLNFIFKGLTTAVIQGGNGKAAMWPDRNAPTGLEMDLWVVQNLANEHQQWVIPQILIWSNGTQSKGS